MRGIIFALAAMLAAVCLLAVSALGEDSMVVHRDIEITGNNRLTLRGYLEGPEAALNGNGQCPLIIIFHGLMDSGEFDLIRKQADAYTAAGYAVLAMDFNGHGRSDGKLIDMTVSRELEDAENILAYAGQLPFASDMVLIGHSQGGAVASVAAARHSDRISSLVLLAPGGALADKLRAGSFFGQSFDPADPPEKLMAFDDYIGRDYITDAIAIDLYGMAEGYAGHPVLLVRGSDDPLVTAEAMEKYEQIYQRPEYGNQVNSVVIDGAPHDFCGFEEQISALTLSFLDGEWSEKRSAKAE